MEVFKNITSRNRTIVGNRKIEYIVIHYVGAVSSAKANSNYFKSTYRGASAHYFVDESSIYEVVEDRDVAWHVGSKFYRHLKCRNGNSIGIEMCCCWRNGKVDVSEGVVERTVELVKELMRRYNIPVENVLRHYDVTGKCCPEVFVFNAGRWSDFLNRLSELVGGKYEQGEAVEVNIPFYFTGAEEENRFLYDNRTELCWIHGDTRSLIKEDRMRARAIVCWDEGDRVLVQVFGDQFWIKMNEIEKVL